MPMQSPHELFLHELGDMYDAEQRLLQILPALAKECPDPQVQQAFLDHERETRQHARNIEQCFQVLGERPRTQTCAAIQGIKQEHDAFLKEKPTDSLLEIFDLGGAAKTEYYEIASYTMLIEQAQLMGHTQVVQLLQQNLQQEQAMARRVEQLGTQFGKQAIQMAGQINMGQQPQAHP